MKINRVKINIYISLLLQITTVINAFILPRMIMTTFGSAYNGIVSSVNQFLSCVTLLRAGVGGVTRASLYKPLAEGNMRQVSAIVKSTEQFMRKIALIFSIFLIGFALIYPLMIHNEFNYFFSFSLVLVLGVSTIAQYYFGITYQFLLHADQKLYIYNSLQIIGILLNLPLCIFLMKSGCDFRWVKLIGTFIFSFIPVLLYLYVKKNYKIDRSVDIDNTTIKQRWDAFAHQISAFVHTNTDIILLTLFSDLYQVSIYAVYSLVTNGVKQLLMVVSSPLEAMLGNIMVTEDKSVLNEKMERYELILNIFVTGIITSTAILIVPFIKVYSRGVGDTNYNQPIFGFLLCLATFLSCIRMPYQNLVEAAGHFRETRNGAIAEAVMNIGISLIFVNKFGCSGVMIGTNVAMFIRTIQYANYASKVILNRSTFIFVKRIGISLSSFMLCIYFYYTGINNMFFNVTYYLQWILFAIIVTCSVGFFVIITNYVFYRKQFYQYIISKYIKK